jgi:hypothetical protein
MERTSEGRRKTYVTPELTVHGTLEEITLACDKSYGSSDGYTFNGLAYACGS